MDSNSVPGIGDYQPPPWACSQWGGYGHDWLDCFECLQNYEKYLEEHEEEEAGP